MVKYFMYTDGRTGSTAMCDVLSIDQKVWSSQELFTFGDTFGAPLEDPVTLVDGNVVEVVPCYRTGLSPSKYLKAVEESLSDAGYCAFGFKLLYNHATHWGGRELLELLRDHGFKPFHNIRTDFKRKALSGYMARVRGVWNSEKDVLYSEKVVVDLFQLEKSIEMSRNRCDMQKKLLIEIFGAILETQYEGFLEDEAKYVNQVFEYLGIGVVRAQKASSWKKVLPNDLSEVVENYKELYDWLKVSNT